MPSAPSALPLPSFADVERSLAASERGQATRDGKPTGVGERHTPGNFAYGDVTPLLREYRLSRGLLLNGAALQGTRLECFVRLAARREVTVASIGGSVTSGMPFGTFTGQDNDRALWLYHVRTESAPTCLVSFRCRSQLISLS